jgi:hypothetical protein
MLNLDPDPAAMNRLRNTAQNKTKNAYPSIEYVWKRCGALLSRVWKAQADPGRDPRYEVAGQVSGGR